MDSALEIEGLCVRFRLYDRTLTAVDNVSLRVERGETMALVGESGSGKTVTSLAVIGLLGSKALVASGSIGVGGRDVLALDAEGLRRLRGAEVGTIFQDPMSSLNPMLTIGEQITETLASHRSDSASEHRAKALSLLAQVRIPQPEATLNFYPHQLSGGMRQRVMIAIAIALDPALIIADEPTTALDVTVQAQVLGLIRDLITAKNAACLFISHDMGVVAQVSDKVSIMYAGSIVEKGPTSSVLAQPWHPYTRGLIDCAPAHDTTARRELLPIPGSMPALGDLPSGCPFAPRCFRAEADCREIKPGLLTLPGASDRAVACHHPLIDSVERPELAPTQARSYSITIAAPALDVRHLSQALGQRGIFGARRTRLIVDDVTLQVPAGSTLGVVGESGSGKSTLVRSIMGLYAGTLGEIRVAGAQVPGGTWPRSLRARMQMVFQDSYSSLNPRMSAQEAISEIVRAHRALSSAEVARVVRDLLDRVGLPRGSGMKYPHELSGGQRQRVGIARALAPNPAIILADEPVSSLDVSVQAQVLKLFTDLQRELGLAYLFITHDLGVVRYVSDETIVLFNGRIVESGPVDAVLDRPAHPYTRTLTASATGKLMNAAPAPGGPAVATGCAFAPRCDLRLALGSPSRCLAQRPELHRVGDTFAACHFAVPEIGSSPNGSKTVVAA